MPRIVLTVIVISSLALLGACGGGGGGGASAPAAPVPRAIDDTARVDEDESVTINVLANDVGVNSSSLAIQDAPSHGSATVNGSTIDYTPAADFNGADALSYTVRSNAGSELSATVSITVTDINDNPIAVSDSVSLVEDHEADVPVTANDSDMDGSITAVVIIDAPANGTATVTDDRISYRPDVDFFGTDTLTYQAQDDDGGLSNTATLSIMVTAITTTTLTVTELTVPSTGYTSVNHPEYADNVLSSPQQLLLIPPNTQSLLITLAGDDVAENNSGLFISNLTAPDASLPAFRTLVNFCDAGLCGALIPRRPDIPATPGRWQFQLGTLAATLNAIALDDLTLRVAIRTGPTPQPSTLAPARLGITPFISSASVTPEALDPVLDRLLELANASNLAIDLAPTVRLTDRRFQEVSRDFSDPITSELVSLGAPARLNIFFIDSFVGPGGSTLLGLSPGIPITQGSAGRHNGILINVRATHSNNTAFFARTTAQIALHEVGHALGLYHTTEADFSAQDVLADTPACTTADDTNNNGTANLQECPDSENLMFWQPDLIDGNTGVSEDQRRVIYRAPIAQ